LEGSGTKGNVWGRETFKKKSLKKKPRPEYRVWGECCGTYKPRGPLGQKVLTRRQPRAWMVGGKKRGKGEKNQGGKETSTRLVKKKAEVGGGEILLRGVGKRGYMVGENTMKIQ